MSHTYPEFLERAAREALAEAKRAGELHHPLRSAHEGWAVLREEVDELWDEVKNRRQVTERMREEAVQVAAVAIRFLADICYPKGV